MKTYLLTGASGGLGLAIAEKLLNEGSFLHLLANRRINRLDTLVSKFPNQTRVQQIDFMSQVDYHKLAESLTEIDGLIHCIGVSSSGVSWKITSNELDRVMHLNFKVPFLISSAFIPKLREKNFGRIIFFSSVVAQKGFFGTSVYSASKSALLGLTKTMSVELIKNNITVNCIAPGYMDSGMIEEVQPEFLNEILNVIPSNKLGESVNVANTVSFLLSDNANYITGQVFNVNGGIL